MGILGGTLPRLQGPQGSWDVGFMVSGFYRDPGLRKPKGTVLGPLSEGILQQAISGLHAGDWEAGSDPCCDILVTSTAQCSPSPQGPRLPGLSALTSILRGPRRPLMFLLGGGMRWDEAGLNASAQDSDRPRFKPPVTYCVTWPNGSSISDLHVLVCKMGIKSTYFITLLLFWR